MIFISGAAGHLGRAVINHLLSTNKVPASDIIAGTRDPAKLADLAAKGIAVRKADFDDEAGLAKALAGVTRFLIISTDSLDKPGHRLEQHLRAVKAAEAAGVSHVVYTSMPRPETSAVLFAPDHLGTEKAIAASRIPNHVILRNNWYFENLLHALPMALKSGTHYAATGDGKTAYIGREDLARGAAAALAAAKPGKHLHTLSGAQQFTTAEVTAMASRLVGKPINVVQVPVAGLVQGMVGAGLPEPIARVFASFDEAIAKGGMEGDAKDFTALTGVAPQSLEAWMKANLAALSG